MFLKIKKYLNNLIVRIARRFFLVAIFLFVFSLLIGFFLFYRYSVMLPEKMITELETPVLFRESIYQRTLDRLEREKEEILEVEKKDYYNIFDREGTEEEN